MDASLAEQKAQQVTVLSVPLRTAWLASYNGAWLLTPQCHQKKPFTPIWAVGMLVGYVACSTLMNCAASAQ